MKWDIMKILSMIQKIVHTDDVLIIAEDQNQAYDGMLCKVNDKSYRVRSGKITPKKKGAFVVMGGKGWDFVSTHQMKRV